MRLLLIDNSNTRTKFALSEGAQLLEWKSGCDTVALSPDMLRKILHGVEYEAAVICSVVPVGLEILKEVLGEKCHIITDNSRLTVGIDYPEPGQIGGDRLANSEAMLRKYGTPGIVIDAGTAVTFDVIDRRKCYVGGVIAPGFSVMSDYFYQKAALLPRFIPTEPLGAIGKTTVEAMNIGAVTGFRGLIREVIAGVDRELGEEVPVIATGGDAELLACGVDRITKVDSTLTLEGIAMIGALNLI